MQYAYISFIIVADSIVCIEHVICCFICFAMNGTKIWMPLSRHQHSNMNAVVSTSTFKYECRCLDINIQIWMPLSRHQHSNMNAFVSTSTFKYECLCLDINIHPVLEVLLYIYSSSMNMIKLNRINWGIGSGRLLRTLQCTLLRNRSMCHYLWKYTWKYTWHACSTIHIAG